MNKKQKDIINTAKELFWKHGVSRITMEEISTRANVSKMTLYKYYSNKKNLALAVLKSEVDRSMKKFRSIIESDLPFEEKLEQMFLMKMEGTKDISSEFINDIYQNPDLGLHTYIEEQSRKSTKMFTSFLKDSQKKGLMRKDVKIPFVVYHINQMIQMVTDKQLQQHYNNPQELIMEMMRFMFYGLLPRK
ncbi:MAG: TetR/AcrR family transcriptional regulator [Bacteroidota bacterium]